MSAFDPFKGGRGWLPKANIVRFLTIFLKSFPYVWKCKSVCVGGWREHLRVRGKTFCYNDSSKDLLHSLKSPSSCFDLSVKVKTDNFVDDWRTLVSFLLFFSVEFLKIVCTCDLFYHPWININFKLLNCLDACMSIDKVFHYNAFAHLMCDRVDALPSNRGVQWNSFDAYTKYTQNVTFGSYWCKNWTQWTFLWAGGTTERFSLVGNDATHQQCKAMQCNELSSLWGYHSPKRLCYKEATSPGPYKRMFKE